MKKTNYEESFAIKESVKLAFEEFKSAYKKVPRGITEIKTTDEFNLYLIMIVIGLMMVTVIAFNFYQPLCELRNCLWVTAWNDSVSMPCYCPH